MGLMRMQATAGMHSQAVVLSHTAAYTCQHHVGRWPGAAFASAHNFLNLHTPSTAACLPSSTSPGLIAEVAVLLELTAAPAGPWSLDQLGWSEAMAEAVRARYSSG